MGIPFSPFNNFKGGVLKFFSPKVRKQLPLGYLTVGADGIVEIDPAAVVIVPNELYTVKPADRILVLPIYGVPGGGNGGQNVVLPNPAEWPGRIITLIRMGYIITGDTFTWRVVGSFSRYANSVLNYNPSYLAAPGTVGSNTPPFTPVLEGTLNLGNTNETSMFTLMSDGTAWFDAMPKPAAILEP